MTFSAGDVVILKSGGQAMTVIGADEEEAICLWIGEDGDLFRETIPTVALQAAELIEDDETSDEDEDDDADGGEDDDEDEDEEGEAKAERVA